MDSGRPRYEALDGLRGVAALCVLAYHAGLKLPSAVDGRPAAFAHGWLAVDLFFVLSGFVIAQAYGERLAAGAGWRAFARARVRRLYPTYLVGLAVSVGGSSLAWMWGRLEIPPAAVAGFAGLAVLLVPLCAGPLAAFPLNPPTWSLLVEAVANAAYALGLRRAGVRGLAGVVILGAAGLLTAVALGVAVNGGSRAGQLGQGLLRGAVSFSLGLLLHRLHADGRLARLRGWPTLGLLGLAAAIFALPASRLDRVLELGFILLGSPLLVAAGVLSRPSPWTGRLCAVAGALSYPLYVLHAPLLELAARLTPAEDATPLSRTVAVAIAVAVSLAGAALMERRALGLVRRGPARRSRARGLGLA